MTAHPKWAKRIKCSDKSSRRWVEAGVSQRGPYVTVRTSAGTSAVWLTVPEARAFRRILSTAIHDLSKPTTETVP